ncbi:MAG TPA: hypothetical protein VMU94_15355 [Streptosporangiaceae bacterium]|nr:hypothetical protein [Streptosporangiaceae bacterium]
MTTTGHDPAGSAVTAVLLQITQHAERLAALDQREAGRYQHITAQLGELAAQLAQARDRLDAVQSTSARQAAILDALDGLDQHVAALAVRVTQLAADGHAGDDAGYQAVPAPRWWALDGTEREDALARLRAWVGQVYRTGYGHLAAGLGACWEQHPLCLYGLDWLMELWSALYLADERDPGILASQAEWQSRLLPALAAQMHAETSHCQHTARRDR